MKVILKFTEFANVIKQREEEMPVLPNVKDKIVCGFDTWEVSKRIIDLNTNQLIIYLK